MRDVPGRYSFRLVVTCLAAISFIGILSENIGEPDRIAGFSRQLKLAGADHEIRQRGLFVELGNNPRSLPFYDDGITRFVSAGTGADQLETPWFSFGESAVVQLAGFPGTQKITVTAEIASGNATRKLKYAGEQPGGKWIAWPIKHITGDTRLRLIVDGPAFEAGRMWVGITAPYSLSEVRQVFLILANTGLSLLVFAGTGVAVVLGLRKFLNRPINFAWVVLPGALLAAVIGLAIWRLPVPLPIRTLGFVACFAWTAAVTACVWLQDWDGTLMRQEKFVLLAYSLLVVMSLGRGLYSVGPKVELYDGTISRSTEVGWTSDSRISYHNMQVALGRWSLDDPRTTALFSPFWFSARGPVAGLAVAPVAAAFNPHILSVHPDQLWEPFDPYGFTSYRISMTVILAMIIIALYGFFTTIQNHQLSLGGSLFVGLSPFFVHETFFTWPKLYGQSIILLAFMTASAGRMFFAGLLMALSYFVHPMAILIMPFIGLWRYVLNWQMDKPRGFRQVVDTTKRTLLYDAVPYALPIILLYILWQMLAPSSDSRSFFFTYIGLADGEPVTLSSWLMCRVHNFLNTLVPLYQFFEYGNYRWIHTPGTTTPASVRWFYQYWSTLPFGIGLCVVPLVYWRTKRLAMKHKTIFSVFVLIPFLLILVSFGSESSGLTRNSGHTVFMAFLTFFWWASTRDGFISPNRLNSTLMKYRVWENIFMIFGPIWLSNSLRISASYALSDWLVIIGSFAACFGLHQIWVREAMTCV